jgi:hypothetical protein
MNKSLYGFAKRPLFKILLFALSFFFVERFCHKQTEGFRPHKVASSFAFDPRWESAAPHSPAEKEQILRLLDQRYTFLGRGGQCYAFESADGTSVLKLFKAHHMRPYPWLDKLPLPPFLSQLRSKLNLARQKRLEVIFGSCALAFNEFREETGLLFIHLNKTTHLKKQLTVVDKLGIAHTLDLDQTEFALQKKAELTLPTLSRLIKENQLQRAKACIDSLLKLIVTRSQKGIADRDPIIKRNFGFINDQAVEIDIGSYSKNDDLKKPYATSRELFFQTHKLKTWLKKHHPELLDYTYQKIDEMLNQHD